MNAIEKKFDEQLDSAFDLKLSELIESLELSNADRVGPEARHKLKGLLKYYAKKEHPFAACVKDNRKRFGPRAEAICAVLKDIIRGTTKWRGHNNPRDHGAPGAVGLSDEMPLIDDETLALVEKLSEMELWDLLGLAQLEDENDTLEFADYSHAERMAMAKKGHALPDGSFPIKNEQDVKNAVKAVGRAKHPLKAKKHIIKRSKVIGGNAPSHVPSEWLAQTHDVILDYPVASVGVASDYVAMKHDHPVMSKDDVEFLRFHGDHHRKMLKKASEYLGKDPHPEVASLAQDAMNNSAHHITRAARVIKNPNY